MTSNSRFVRFSTPDDLNAVEQGAVFTPTWRLRNTGDTTWGAGFQVVHIGGTQMAAAARIDLATVAGQATVPPNSEVDITIPMTAPDVFGRLYSTTWQLQDNQGNRFGVTFFVKAVVVKKTITEGNFLNSDSRFLDDVTVPDGTLLQAGETFSKIWLVKNTGQRKWGSGYRLVYVGGDNAMTGTLSHPVPDARPGEDVVLSVPMVAPTEARDGDYVGFWRLHDDRNVPFGDRFWIKIRVTQPDRPAPAIALSQNDPRWRDLPLGHGPRTIGQFGCLLTSMAMMLNARGDKLTPVDLNERFLQLPPGQGFNGDVLFFAAPRLAFNDIRFVGNFKPFSDTGAAFANLDPMLVSSLDNHLAQGGLALMQVDLTPATAYDANVEQHWVYVVARNGNDYLVIDPLDGRETSLLAKYGRQGSVGDPLVTLKNAIKSVLMYFSTRKPVQPAQRMLTGMNINPDDAVSNPMNSQVLKGMDWVRFPFKAADKQRSVEASFAEYDPLVNAYANQGVGSLVVLNQQTVAGNDAPWVGGGGSWEAYAARFAQSAGIIAAHYAHLGDKIAYEIWNEGDNPATPWVSVFVPAAKFAIVLQQAAAAIRQAAPQAKIIFGGLSTGPVEAAEYVRQCREALHGDLPVDAIGVHPYGRWPVTPPFAGWGFGKLDDVFSEFQKVFPNTPLWITEIGIPGGSTPLGAEHYGAVAAYLRDTYVRLARDFSPQVGAIIWFAWSDNMENAGIVTGNGSQKTEIFNTFVSIRDRRLPELA